MRELLLELKEELENKTHLKDFLRNTVIEMEIETELEKIVLLIQNGTIEILEKSHLESNVKITGNDEVIRSIILGEIKLRQAVNQNLVSMASSYRATLYLETLFILARPQLKSA